MSLPITSMASYRAQLKEQRVPFEHYAFVCPACQKVQSAQDFIQHGIAANPWDAEKYLGYICIHRLAPGQRPSDRCTLTLAIGSHPKAVHLIDSDHRHHFRFPPACRKAALMHRREHLERLTAAKSKAAA